MESWAHWVSYILNGNPSGFTYFARDPMGSWFHEQTKNWIYFLNVFIRVTAHQDYFNHKVWQTGDAWEKPSYYLQAEHVIWDRQSHALANSAIKETAMRYQAIKRVRYKWSQPFIQRGRHHLALCEYMA